MDYDLYRIVEHGGAADMAEKYKDHWQAKEHDENWQPEMYKDHWKAGGLLCDLVPEATVYRSLWRNHGESEYTFQTEADSGDNAVFEDYIEKHCPGPSRYLSMTEETLQSVRRRLEMRRKDVCIDQIEAAIRDLEKLPPHALQERFPSIQSRCLDPADGNNDLRLVYMLLDAGILRRTRNCDRRTFARALFYVGKGTMSRPFKHLEEAKNYLLKPGTTETSRCARYIADIWRNGDAVIVFRVVTNVLDDDAVLCEAAIISLRDSGLSNLLNSSVGVLEGQHTAARMELGVREFASAFNLCRATEQKRWYLWNVPPTTKQIQAWHSGYLKGTDEDYDVEKVRQGKQIN